MLGLQNFFFETLTIMLKSHRNFNSKLFIDTIYTTQLSDPKKDALYFQTFEDKSLECLFLGLKCHPELMCYCNLEEAIL